MTGKPLYEDEAIAGLIAMRPLGEVLDTVLLDRGGAPLHFVLAHVAFEVDASADALRWLSVAFALATVPLCFDLARRLAGVPAGLVAAAVAASSTALAVYGSFGRMYSLFAFAAALAADLFVRALERRTPGAAVGAGAAAWLLPAVHPYGAIPAAVELIVALALARRFLALPAALAAAAIAAVPFLVADLRLADRAAVGTDGARALASPEEAWGELVAAVSAFAGGDGVPLLFFTALAIVGAAVLAVRLPAVAAVGASLALPPFLFAVVRTETAPDLSPRHLFYALPLWAAAIGVGASWLARPLPRAASALALATVAVIAVVSPPSSLRDPRDPETFPLSRGGRADALAEPSARIRESVRSGDVLLPYSTVFLAALPDARGAVVLPHAPGDLVVRALTHAEPRIGAVFVAVPPAERGKWRVVRLEGPFDRAGALSAAARALAQVDHPRSLDGWFAWIEPGLCDALRELERACPAR